MTKNISALASALLLSVFILLSALTTMFVSEGRAYAAHPLRLTDYSNESRIELEIAYGKMNNPLPSDYLHYLLSVDANVYQGLHVLIALPFSGYSGVDGSDNFIRGNMLLGATYKLPIAEWVSLGFALKLYTPTYERAASVDFGLKQDPRRAVLTHWHYRFQYALEDSFPISPEVAVKFEYAGFFAQLEGSFTWAANIRDRSDIYRKAHVWMLQYGLGIGYDLFGYAEILASITGLFDPEKDGSNLGDILGKAYNNPRSLTVATIGSRFQYKWAVFRFEANFPLEKSFREMLDPYYLFALQAQF